MGCSDRQESSARISTLGESAQHNVSSEQRVRSHPALPIVQADFLGADACAACHQDQYDAWRSSTHARAGGPADEDLLIIPFDGREIRFRDAVVLPEQTAAGEARFVVDQEGFDPVVFAVDGVVGGGHMLGGGTQGFVSRYPDGTVRFLPFDYSRQGDVWFCNTGSRLEDGWVPISEEMSLADCGDWPPVRVLGTVPRFANCQSCHGSQISVTQEPGAGLTTEWTSLGITCESCHGPGRKHVDWVSEGGAGPGVAMLSKSTDGVDESLDTCFSCHALKDVVDEGYLSGMSLEQYYALKLPILGDDPYLADGRIKTFGYQATHLSSACYLSGSMTCVSCHEPHSQGYWDENRRALSSPFDDGQCTSCHAAKAVDPQAHTNHPPSSEGARCVSCHMPYLQHPEVGEDIPFARSDHTIPVPRPAVDGRLGLVSACRGCHLDQSEIQLQSQAETWWGEIKPHRPLVAGMLQVTEAMGAPQAARLLLRPQETDPLIQFQALARFLQGWVRVNGGLPDEALDPIRQLSDSGDLDLQALALATLHWSGVRSGVAEEPPLDQARTRALHRRWAMILSFLGDEARDVGDLSTADLAYGKALEILPNDPQIHLSIGLARNQEGAFAEGAEAFRRSLTLDPNQALAYVNLGVALSGLGDAAGALGAYQDALAVDPNEPLAHFNMGNAYLRSGDLPRAVTAYQGAVRVSPGLAQAHFALSVALIQGQRYEEALPHARRAVEFNPGDPRARQMLQDLLQATGS